MLGIGSAKSMRECWRLSPERDRRLPVEEPNPTLDLLMILIAELQRDGVLDRANITSMVRRLELSDLPDLAQRVQMIPFSNAMDDPEEIRGGMYAVDGGLSDGGKHED